MRILPILFSTPMVESIQDNTKTQTRRIVKGSIPIGNWDDTVKFSKIQEGDILWVRETWQYDYHWVQGKGGYVYKVDRPAPSIMLDHKWKPSIFMPKDACRIFLKVKSVRLEKLQDISKQDAISEGIEVSSSSTYKDYIDYPHDIFEWFTSPIDSFQSLWLSINGKKSWNENPWVWVYEFEKTQKPITFNQ